jgi:hypothetical protein
MIFVNGGENVLLTKRNSPSHWLNNALHSEMLSSSVWCAKLQAFWNSTAIGERLALTEDSGLLPFDHGDCFRIEKTSVIGAGF